MIPNSWTQVALVYWSSSCSDIEISYLAMQSGILLVVYFLGLVLDIESNSSCKADGNACAGSEDEVNLMQVHAQVRKSLGQTSRELGGGDEDDEELQFGASPFNVTEWQAARDAVVNVQELSTKRSREPLHRWPSGSRVLSSWSTESCDKLIQCNAYA